VISQTRSAHAPTFEVAVVIDSEQVGEGQGRTKREAEHAAAESALEHLGASPAPSTPAAERGSDAADP
jgi:dsRNA-specific ribonuclease